MVRAIGALETAAAREPGYGQTWSMLACLYARNFGLEIVDLPTSLERAAEFARKGIRLDPINRRARMILACVRYLQNRLPEAQNEIETAYQLNPDSLIVLDRIGWLMALVGDWQRGVKWVEKAIRLNPYHRPWVRHALILNWLRLENYEEAYRETFNLMMPDFFWDQILKATACGHMGKIEAGQAWVQELLAQKPDFRNRGRILIEKYIRLEDIADRIIEGLGKLDLKIEM
jgi:tetratricopeptide (TPR) repeat protein